MFRKQGKSISERVTEARAVHFEEKSVTMSLNMAGLTVHLDQLKQDIAFALETGAAVTPVFIETSAAHGSSNNSYTAAGL